MPIVGLVGYSAVVMATIKRRKPAEARRSVYLRVRLTEEHDAMIKEAAAAAGILVSAWVVERLVRAAKAELRAEEKA